MMQICGALHRSQLDLFEIAVKEEPGVVRNLLVLGVGWGALGKLARVGKEKKKKKKKSRTYGERGVT